MEVGVRRRAATRLNEAFFTWVVKERPFVIMKVAKSLDGGISAGNGRQTWLTASAANDKVHGLRAEVDALGGRVNDSIGRRSEIDGSGYFSKSAFNSGDFRPTSSRAIDRASVCNTRGWTGRDNDE